MDSRSVDGEKENQLRDLFCEKVGLTLKEAERLIVEVETIIYTPAPKPMNYLEPWSYKTYFDSDGNFNIRYTFSTAAKERHSGEKWHWRCYSGFHIRSFESRCQRLVKNTIEKIAAERRKQEKVTSMISTIKCIEGTVKIVPGGYQT